MPSPPPAADPMSAVTPDDLRDYLRQLPAKAPGLAPFEAAGGHGWIASCLPSDREALQLAARRPPPGMSIRKFGTRSVVGRYESAKSDLVLKYYYPRSPLKRLTYGLRGSRAVRSWTAGLAFSFAGIPTAAPLALLEWRSCGLLLDKSFLAVRHLPGIPLDDFARRHGDDPASLEPLAGNLRDIFSRMALLRIAHGDLKASNIIVDDDGGISFIDLDAATILTPENQWSAGRARDIRLFRENWLDLPGAAAVFARVFD